MTETPDQEFLRERLAGKWRLSETGCWEWLRSKNPDGYGDLRIRGPVRSAHRVSYEAHIGPIPAGMLVRHSCDNPGCINPSHLLLGTTQDNVDDREERGRRDVRGEDNGMAKLTEADVIHIRTSPARPKELCEMYGIDRTNVWAIRAGKTWKHVGLAA